MFYLVKIQTASDDTVTQAVFRYDNYDDALSAFHSELAYRSPNRKATVCVILDRVGGTHKVEAWGDTEPHFEEPIAEPTEN